MFIVYLSLLSSSLPQADLVKQHNAKQSTSKGKVKNTVRVPDASTSADGSSRM